MPSVNKEKTKADTWWSAKWLEMLQNLLGARYQRIRAGARKVEYDFFRIEAGAVKAKIRERRKKPCYVKLALSPLGEGIWRPVLQSMKKQAIWRAKLLSGALPESCETLFSAHGTYLLPDSLYAFENYCAEHGKSSLCKHTGFVFFHFADLFSADPLLIFVLRGVSRERLERAFTAASSRPDGGGKTGYRSDAAERKSGSLSRFWNASVPLEGFAEKRLKGLGSSSFVENLGPSSYEIRGRNLKEFLLRIYETIKKKASKP